jgi:hypothetical protein
VTSTPAIIGSLSTHIRTVPPSGDWSYVSAIVSPVSLR